MNRVILSLVVFSSSISTLVNAQTIERSQVLVANFNAPLPLSPLGTSYVPLRVPPFGYIKNAVSKPWGFDTFLGTVAPSIPFGADDNKGAPKNCKNNTFNKHLGSDYAAPAGTTVYAIADGFVRRVNEYTDAHDYYVVVESGSTDKWTTLYGHLNKPLFNIGKTLSYPVKKGDIIGTLFDYRVSGDIPHLHLGIRLGPYVNVSVDDPNSSTRGYACAENANYQANQFMFISSEQLKYFTYYY